MPPARPDGMGANAKTFGQQGGRGIPCDRLAATLALDAPIVRVPGVSPARAKAFEKIGVRSVRDLLSHYPRRYVDMSNVATVAQATVGSMCTVSGTVHEVKLKKPKPRLTLVEISVVDRTGVLMVTCFRQPWLAEKLKPGMSVAVSGKVEFNYGFKRMTNPFLEALEGGAVSEGLVVAVHPATEKLSTAWIRRFVSSALRMCSGLYDPIPLEYRIKHRLVSRQSALACIHEPRSMAEVKQARRRLAYEELLMLELHLMGQARARERESNPVRHAIEGAHLRAFRRALPFVLSDEQEKAVGEMLAAMASPRQARHMVLGDVGTGKTVVAAHALAAAADSGGQAFMMAPTEVLARQYAVSLGPLLDEAGVTWEILTGSTKPSERDAIIQRAQAGVIDVLFGTHALLEDDVEVPSCTLVIIDEQQRFGVNQREKLVSKGPCVDQIYLTATPIPRTLALAVYGDFTLSYIKSRPLNRAGNTTVVLDRSEQGRAYDAALAALREGRQVYVVCPLIGQAAEEKDKASSSWSASDEESYDYAFVTIEGDEDMPSENLKAAQTQAAFLQSKVFVDYKVDLLHGGMSGDEKREVMGRFSSGESQVLVATTVIEVGVDVPNATVMIVEDADRFGLSQLHQLRGRIGRGSHPGEAFLISTSRNPVALERLSVMERTEDGFEVAEHDLALRREGDILGNRQHGSSILKLVNVVRDKVIVEAAYEDASALLEQDPFLEMPANRAIAREVRMLFGHEAGAKA